MRAAQKPRAPGAVEPALVPFLDALAALLAADRARTEEARRALRDEARRLAPGAGAKAKGGGAR